MVDYTTPGKLAPFIESNIPEAIHTCRTFDNLDLGVLSYGENKFTIPDVCLADSSFFSVFSFPVIQGNRNKPFEDKLSLVISRSLAERIFKDEDAVGKTLVSDRYGSLHVTAVMADMPANSSIRYEAIMPMDMYPDVARQINYGPNYDWSNFYFNTYVMIADGAGDVKTLSNKLSRAAFAEAWPNETFTTGCPLDMPLIQLTSMHLYASDGTPTGIKNVRLFSIIAIALLLIAVINYVNLVTARMIKRSKEIVVRKILGSNRISLFMQMIRESGIMTAAGLLSATLLMQLSLPLYNQLIEKELEFNFFSPSVILAYLLLFVLITLLAGAYPAWIMCSPSFNGLSEVKLSGKSLLRKVLVTFQFVLSAGMITATIVTGSQLNYMRKQDPGYERENILSARMFNIIHHYEVVKNELTGESFDVTAASARINNVGWRVSRSDWKCKDGEKRFGVTMWAGDYNLLDFFNIKLVSGRMFNADDKPYQAYIINKTLREKFGWDEVNGKTMPLFSNNEIDVTGEIDDFNFKSLHSAIGPMVIAYTDSRLNYIYVKAAPGRASQAVAALEKVWKRYNDGYPFEYRFIDEEFDRTYKSDIRTGKLFNAFAGVAILISCLGLFGLVTFTAESKTKEIGIRKVFGASVADIVIMLGREFMILVGVAMLIAFPLAYLWLERMLQDYAYRIDIAWWMFALAAVITILLTLLTVGWQALKAATANPVKAITTT
jgi:ABC-type antimicrobial peptide transport system permease subunit